MCATVVVSPYNPTVPHKLMPKTPAAYISQKLFIAKKRNIEKTCHPQSLQNFHVQSEISHITLMQQVMLSQPIGLKLKKSNPTFSKMQHNCNCRCTHKKCKKGKSPLHNFHDLICSAMWYVLRYDL
jgi:hypothetical protein